MFRRTVSILILLATVGVAFVVALNPATGNPGYLAAFRQRYPASTLPDDYELSPSVGSSCITCHDANVFYGDWNCYRRDLIERLRAGRSITEALADIEMWDSDGDGVNNITEINLARDATGLSVGYNPGLIGSHGTDPCLTILVGDVPGSTLPGTFRLETPPPPGACCRGSTCLVVSALACSSSVGRFVGTGIACNPTADLTTPCCLSDFDQNGSSAITDIFEFLAAWFAADPRADFNAESSLTVADIFDFLAAWFAGC